MQHPLLASAPNERMSAYRYFAVESGLSGSSVISSISTLLIQCPLFGEPAGAYNGCIGRESAIATPNERMADYCVIGITSGWSGSSNEADFRAAQYRFELSICKGNSAFRFSDVLAKIMSSSALHSSSQQAWGKPLCQFVRTRHLNG
jgi:hypothetical protein